MTGHWPDWGCREQDLVVDRVIGSDCICLYACEQEGNFTGIGCEALKVV